MLHKYTRPLVFNHLFDRLADEDFYVDVKSSRLDLESKVEDDGSTSFTMDLPGVKQEDLNIEVEDRLVTIKAERKTKTSSYSVNKTFNLSDQFDASTLEAHLEDGVLTLNVKQTRQEERKPRKIPILSAKK